MPIDPGIALSVRPPQLPDPLESYARLMQIKGQQQQQALHEQMAPLELQRQQQQVDAGQMAIEEKKRNLSDMQAIDSAFAQPGGRDAVLNALPGHLKPVALKQFEEIDKSHAEVVKAAEAADVARTEAFGRAAVFVREHGYEPVAIQAFLSDFKQKYADDPRVTQQLQGFEQQLQANPTKDGIKALVDPLIASSSQRKVDISAQDAAARAASAAKPTTATLALDAAGGDPVKALEIEKSRPEQPLTEAQRLADQRQTAAQAETGRHNKAMEARPVAGAAPAAEDDAKAIAAAIMRGEQPPTLTGMYRQGPAIRAELAKNGYSLATAQTDWQATQKHIATLNGAQQTRLRQSVDNAAHSLDVIEDLAKQWDAGGFKLLNKVRLAAAKEGALGSTAQTLATRLDAQISDVTSELGNVYMGGNSPTDHALGLAAKNLSADWSRETLTALINQARKNLQIRQNSMVNAGVAGGSANNPYAAPAPAQAAPAAPAGPSGLFNYQDYLKQKGGK